MDRCRARSLQARVEGSCAPCSASPGPMCRTQPCAGSSTTGPAPVLAAAGRHRAGGPGRVDLVRALRAMVPAEVMGDLDRLAPVADHRARRSPSPARLRARAAGRSPSWRCGCRRCSAHETPTVAGGRLPVVLHLLSPAGRPVQAGDLAGVLVGVMAEVLQGDGRPLSSTTGRTTRQTPSVDDEPDLHVRQAPCRRSGGGLDGGIVADGRRRQQLARPSPQWRRTRRRRAAGAGV